MTQRLGILICLVALTVSPNYVMAQQQSEQTKSPATQNSRRSMREIVMMPVVYRVTGMDNVQVKSDLRYTNINNPHLLMDVYIPPGLAKDERRPAVLFIHGNVPAVSPAKNMGIFTSWGRLVAASGMVGVTFTHRLGYPKPQLSEAASDVNAAINHYLLMPEKYDGSSRQDREEILGYTSETIIDIKNGYISYTTPLSGEVFEAALFKRPDGEYILAYNENCDLQYNVPTKLFFLKYADGKWTDVTTQLLPLPINSRHKYKLPQIGTTIKVTNAKGQKMYDLAWENGKFQKQ